MRHSGSRGFDAASTREITALAVRAALEAGRIALEGFRQRSLVVTQKTDMTDVVTQYDGRCEQHIRSLILAAHPDSSIVGEETGALEGSGPLTWFVDPIDGTANYARGIALWAVSIGVAFEGEMIAGAIYDPAGDELFWADDRGAFLAEGLGASRRAASRSAATIESRSSPLRSSGGATPSQSTVALNFPLPRDLAHDRALALEQFARVTETFAQVRAVHSTCIALAWVAAGWIDATISFETHPWDVAAGAFIVRRAGGEYRGYRAGETVDEDHDHLAPHYFASVPGGDFELLLEIMRTQSLRPMGE